MKSKKIIINNFAVGISYHQKGDLQNAKIYYKKEIKINPSSDVYSNLGMIYQVQNDLINAKKCYEKAIKINPNDSDIYYNLGNLYRSQADLINAQICYKKAIELNSRNNAAYYNLGNVYKAQNDLINAKKCYEKAIEIDPTHSDAYSNLGMIYKAQNNLIKSEEYYEKAIVLNPNNSNAYSNLGNLYQDRNDLIKAEECYEKAKKLNSNDSDIHYNLGNLYQERNDLIKAEECYEKAKKLNPNGSNIHYNLGNLYQERNDLIKAEECYEKAIVLNPKHINAIWNLSLVHLLKKEYKIGFKKYRYRYHDNKTDINCYIVDKQTILTSVDNIKNKTILISNEQGFGDMIQFIRFVSKFIEKGASIICVVQTSLIKLFQYNYPEVSFVSTRENLTFDYNFPIMDSAYILGTTYDTIDYSNKYLEVNKDDSKIFAKEHNLNSDMIKIGIIYKGSKEHKNDINRSIELELLLQNLNRLNKNIKIHSLQYDIDEKDNKLLEQYNIINLGSCVEDFYDTALIVDNMDMILSVDTSVVHLCGAMGKKTFVLLPFAPDWRWGLDEDKTSWYDSITLFRQDTIGNWNSILEKVVNSIDNNDRIEDIEVDNFATGVSFHQKGDFTAAKIYYERAIKTNPKHSDAYINLGTIYQEENNLTKAQECYEKLLMQLQ